MQKSAAKVPILYYIVTGFAAGSMLIYVYLTSGRGNILLAAIHYILIEIAAAIKTMCADTLFRQSDGLYQSLYLVEFHTAQPEPASYFLHHALVLRTVCSRILVEILVGITFEILYYAAGDKFKVAFGCGETD